MALFCHPASAHLLRTFPAAHRSRHTVWTRDHTGLVTGKISGGSLPSGDKNAHSSTETRTWVDTTKQPWKQTRTLEKSLQKTESVTAKEETRKAATWALITSLSPEPGELCRTNSRTSVTRAKKCPPFLGGRKPVRLGFSCHVRQRGLRHILRVEGTRTTLPELTDVFW